MNINTESILLSMLYKGKPKDCEFVIDLFDVYTTLEIKNEEELFRGHKEFTNFIKQNRFAFVEGEREGAIYLANRRVHALTMFNFNNFYPNMKKNFVNFSKEVEELVGRKKNIKILEVGGGKVPYSSIILGKDGYDISCMDDIYLSKDCLAGMNVKSYRQMFKYSVKTQDFDVVVARRPCSAIPDIVSSCSKQKVPYFMRLCACDLPSGKLADWRPILQRIDSGINFYDTYAYNLDNANFHPTYDVEDIISIDEDMDKF
jgi:hypothetical protein